MKRRSTIIALVILLAVGFATVSTTLVLNGVIGLGESDDFKIIFTSASIDGTKRSDVIGTDKTTINYETKTLTTVDEESILDYEATNTSRNYDAEVSIECNIVDNEGNKIEGNNIYVDMTYEPNQMTLLSGETKSGKITTRLIKAVTEPMDINIKCTLNATPKERDTLGEGNVDSNELGGTMMAVYDSDNEDYYDLAAQKTWNDNIIPNVTKVVFESTLTPHETTEDLMFDVSENQDGSVMSYLVPNEDDTTKYTLYINSDGKVVANSNSAYLFAYFSNLTEIVNLKYLDTSNVTDMSKMFYNCSNLTILDLSGFDTSKVTSMRWMFSSCSNLTTLDLSNFNTSSVIDLSRMFYYCKNLTTLNVSNFNTSSVTDMSGMFSSCRSLTTLDLSNFNTSKVTDMSQMFGGCSSLTTLNVSNFHTSSVTDMSEMFSSCIGLTTLDISNFDTSNVTSMASMFSECSSLTTLDLSNFNTSNVTSMASMFNGCSSLTSLNLSNFNTSNVIDMSAMFENCSSLTTLDLSNFDTSNVTNMSYMFNGCSSLTTLDLSNFNISNVTDMFRMFSDMQETFIIKVKDKTTQDRILALSSSDRPTAWTTENVVIKEA